MSFSARRPDSMQTSRRSCQLPDETSVLQKIHIDFFPPPYYNKRVRKMLSVSYWEIIFQTRSRASSGRSAVLPVSPVSRFTHDYPGGTLGGWPCHNNPFS